MKKPVNFILLLVFGLLLQIMQQVATQKTVNQASLKSVSEEVQCTFDSSLRFTCNNSGIVSEADNRYSNNTTHVCENEDRDKRRQQQQKLLEALSVLEFRKAKSHSQNECITSKRQPYFHSILTENRQLRL